ncbi:MAG: hypothetical protein LUF84_01395 [Clostridiales bacterium]|nr:hypothetical protein [Clostridiales bacterium]
MKGKRIYLAALLCALWFTGCGGETAVAQSASSDLAAEAAGSVSADASTEADAEASGSEGTEPEVVEAEYCVWPGFLDRTVTEDDHTLPLANDGDNTVTLSFVIMEADTGTVLYESGPVAPGETALWDIYEAYTAGSHTITITTTAETGNRLEQQIVLTLPEEGE